MDRKTKQKVFLSSLCFLALIYALASNDGGRRKKAQEEVATMSEQKDKLVLAEEKIMYITFNDGPSANTEKILDILDTYSIKATFFVTKENPEYSDMIKSIHDRGHTLGIHTYAHEYDTMYANTEAYMQDIQNVAKVIKEKSGQDVRIIRFPGGSNNRIANQYNPGIMNELVNVVVEEGFAYYDWNAHNGDGDPSISSANLYTNTMKAIEGKSEVMMLMHDGANNNNTVTALDDVLQSMIKQGWTFKTIEDASVMNVFHHSTENE